MANKCEICRRQDDIEVHHIRALTDLTVPGQPQPDWAQITAKQRRKTLVVCDTCHDRIHNRQPAAPLTQ
jgi:hypothetical protein